MSSALLAAFAGLGLGLALIVAIGAQNAFVLRQGLRGEHVVAVVAVCALSDLLLIIAGVAGTGALLDRVPTAVPVMRWLGAAFLLGYGALAARRALRPAGALVAQASQQKPLLPTVLTASALTWLNPHVYLDTVVLLGSVAATHDDLRWHFGAGAAVGSLLWFSALGAGARLLRPVFAKPGAWRVLDATIAVVMGILAVGLVRGAGG
ncbi:MAG: amino acid transporter [Frankiales bacterium]|nr:MAG: amino acid transporter [Frankiales bacterium]